MLKLIKFQGNFQCNFRKKHNRLWKYKYNNCVITFIPDIYNEKAAEEKYFGFIRKDSNNDKLWFDLGYGANGILFGILGGMMLSELYLKGKGEDLNLFKVDRFDKKIENFFSIFLFIYIGKFYIYF